MSLAKGILAGLALGVASLAFTPAVAIAGVVVSSSGPSSGDFPVGRQISDTQRITLRAGDTITVLDNGGTRVLRGAGTFSLSSQGGATRNRAFASLTTQRSATRARTGAVRGVNLATVSNPNLWYVDVKKSGTICVQSLELVRLWRDDTQAEGTYSIAEGAETTGTQVTFPAGEMLALWDIYSPPSEGTTYTIGDGPGDQAVQVNFVVLEDAPAAAEDLAAALISNGCTVQLEQMANAMAGD